MNKSKSKQFLLNKVQFIILAVILIILCIPKVEMLDGNSEVNWTLFDFILAFILLTSVSFSIEWILRKIENKKIKTAVILFLVLSFLLLWGELAVGIFDSPIAGD